MILSLVIFSIISGIAISATGYPNPFMIGSVILAAVGAGIMSTFEVKTDPAHWVGYQLVFGIGIGLGLQQAIVVIQASLSQEDIAVGTAIVIFAQTLGGTIFICVAQNVFQNKLVGEITHARLDGLDAAAVLEAGATQIRKLVPSHFLPIVLDAYNTAITETFYVSVATASLAILGAMASPWVSVKGKKTQGASA